ncbi:MAG: hypothetical protein ABI870_05535 [Rhodanobacter sp.]
MDTAPEHGLHARRRNPRSRALAEASERVGIGRDAHRIPALRRHDRDFAFGHSVCADDAYWQTRCHGHLAQLDRLLQNQSTSGDLDLRAYLRAR